MLKIHYPKQVIVKFLDSRFPETPWAEVLQDAPPIIWRHRWDHLAEKFGLPYSRGHIQNLDCRGTGPAAFMERG